MKRFFTLAIAFFAAGPQLFAEEPAPTTDLTCLINHRVVAALKDGGFKEIELQTEKASLPYVHGDISQVQHQMGGRNFMLATGCVVRTAGDGFGFPGVLMASDNPESKELMHTTVNISAGEAELILMRAEAPQSEEELNRIHSWEALCKWEAISPEDCGFPAQKLSVYR